MIPISLLTTPFLSSISRLIPEKGAGLLEELLPSLLNAELVGEVGLWAAFKLPDITAFTDIHLLRRLSLLFFRGLHVPSQDDLNSFRLLLQQLQREGIGHIVSIVSLLPEPDADQFSASLRQQMKTLVVDSLFLTLEDMQRIVSSTDPRGILISLLLKQVNLLTLSPYKTSGPTDRKMFYGRAIELRDISEHIVSRSYAIIGGRRVGKSSLLILLHQHNLPDAGIRSLYYDCSTSTTYEEFVQSSIRLWQAGEMRKDLPTTFRELFLTPPNDKPLVLLLDEADKLIPADRARDWSLFKKLRRLINSGQGNIVLSGERTLRQALEDPSSPLYNLAESKFLGPLDYQAVEGLVTVPLKQLEIKLIDEKAIVDKIWEATDGHPNVVQRICDRLIALLNKRGVRQITLDNVYDILNAPEFQERDFLSTYWEQASELEKLITLLMVRTGDMQCTRARIVHLLAENAIVADEQAVKDALINLDTLRSILRRSQDGYSFAFTFFPQVLTNLGVEDLFQIYKKMYLD